MPRHLLFFDTETKTEELPYGGKRQQLYLGYSCYYRRAYGRHLEKTEWQDFRTCDAFWNFVFSHTERKNRLWVIARNLTFDFTVVKGWQYLREAGYKLKFFYSEGSTSIISVTKKGSSIVFLDSMNWFPESVEKTGERIGLPKLKIDFETCTEAELLTYCHRDVEIEFENFKLFMRFLTANRISRLCYTRGSTAMAAFLLGHYTTKIYVHNNKQAIQLEREAYKGGRCECFYIGDLNDETYYTLDVNSLYPYVMRNSLFPVRYIQKVQKAKRSDLLAYLQSNSVVARVLINTDEPVYAVRKQRTTFPIGRFVTTLCTPELKYAIEHGHLERVMTTVRYEQANIFRNYVDKFYGLRLEFKSAGVGVYEQLCKYMLNSLYGKFGQKAEEWVKIGKCPNEPDRVEMVYYVDRKSRGKFRYLLGELWELVGHDESFDSCPAIAAHVTAYARLYLWQLMQQAGYGNYFYCDTDSLIVNQTGFDNLYERLDESELGALKIQEKSDRICIRGLKDYTTSEKTVIKGVRKNAVQIADGVYEQDSWPGFKGLLQSGHVNTYTIQRRTKHLCRDYTKGTVQPDGTVYPFVLDAPVESSESQHLPF